MTRAFIVRPFGTRSGIDFDAVESQLIQPALEQLNVAGGTTGKILEAGNIREDMFQQLLVADLVVADVSLHNANVFYELGIRHSLQPRRTFLIRARQNKPPAERKPEDEVPFDLRTERYLEYDPANPGASLPQLSAALTDTLASERVDSPVFTMLPDLAVQDRSKFLPVPMRFREEVELAAKGGQIGLLGLLSLEVRPMPWASEGLRLIGRAQVNLRAYAGARTTWEALVQSDALDTEANQFLATIYQRLGDINASDQALQRVLTNRRATSAQRAEALSLMGRNLKDRWRSAWSALEGEAAAAEALRSPYLGQAFEKYKQGFDEDLNSFYPGLNALSLLTILIGLARRLPDPWQDRYQDASEAARSLQDLESQHVTLAGAVWSALSAAKARLARNGGEDRWLEISIADYRFLTTDRPARVGYAYRDALAGAASFHVDSARAQVQIFERLGLRLENVRSAMEVFAAGAASSPAKREGTAAALPARVILFTGHMVDEPGRQPPRFPPESVANAYQAIRLAIEREKERTAGPLLALASAASGGDILFHEACTELGIETRLLLPLPADRFRGDSVSPGGRDWETRFDRIIQRFPSPSCLARTDALPSWLTGKARYNSWQRANLWLVQEALAVSAPQLTLIALWDGSEGDGPGGTKHMIDLARENNASTVVIGTQKLMTAQPTASLDSATGVGNG